MAHLVASPPPQTSHSFDFDICCLKSIGKISVAFGGFSENFRIKSNFSFESEGQFGYVAVTLNFVGLLISISSDSNSWVRGRCQQQNSAHIL